jgi:stage II sporulation protein M
MSIQDERAVGFKAWQSGYLRELKPYFIASVILILAGTVCGVASSIHIPTFSNEFEASIREFARGFLSLPRPSLALAIFLNNAFKTLAVIVLGLFAGLLPLVFLLVNGYVLGLVLHASLQSKGLVAFFLAIAPHGLFELPAILLGASIGLMLGARAIKQMLGREERALGREVARGLRFFVTVIAPMLLLAALIEAFVSSALASK